MKKIILFVLTLILCQTTFSQDIHTLKKIDTPDNLSKRYEGRFRKFDVLSFDHHILNAQLKKGKRATFELNVEGGGAKVESKP